MLDRLRAHLTYANVVATPALFVALGGSAVAARVLITKPSQLKNGVVTGKKIKKGSIGLDRLSKKARASLAGKQGAQGAKGDPGAPKPLRCRA